MEKTKIVFLYENSYEKGMIVEIMKEHKIEITSKNKGIVNLKDKCIVLKKLNVNKANQLYKYKDCLILYNNQSGEIEILIKQLLKRCTAKLNITSINRWIENETISQYLREDADNLQIRYVVDFKTIYDYKYSISYDKYYIRQIYSIVTDKEKDLNVISNKDIRNGTNLYLDMNDTINEYKKLLTNMIDKYIQDKSILENRLSKKQITQLEKRQMRNKVRDIDFNIEVLKKILKKPQLKTLI